MTCIVGLVHDGKVTIGGDSAGVAGLDFWIRADQKVWAKDGWVFGGTTSFRMLQILRYSMVLPKRHPDTDLMQFMVTEFIDAVRKCMRDGGFMTKDKEAEQGGTFLVGTAGRLFRICGDFQVGESTTPYDACGCGEPFARGAMAMSTGVQLPADPGGTVLMRPMAPRERVLGALQAAETHSAGVRGPFHIVSI